VFISRELWLDFCKCSFCKTWQDSCGFALFARPLFCLKDRTEAGKGNSGLAEAQRVVEETANGSRRNDRKQRESRYGEHTRCYHISKYTSRFSYFLGVRTRMCWGAFERGGRSIGRLVGQENRFPSLRTPKDGARGTRPQETPPRATPAHGAPSPLSSALNFSSGILPPLVAVKEKEQEPGSLVQASYNRHRGSGRPLSPATPPGHADHASGGSVS
jgi:hypothetical protein